MWRFLFGMYPCSSTALERSLLQEQLIMRYQVMKRKWQQFLPSAVRMHLNGTDGKNLNILCPSEGSHISLHSLLCFVSLKTSNDLMIQLSWWQRSGTSTRGRHRPSSRPRISQRRSETDWLSWSFRHRLDKHFYLLVLFFGFHMYIFPYFRFMYFH